jgi:signal peptidase I
VSRSNARDHARCELIAEALRLGRSVRIRVTGTSMLPAIWPGDIIAVAHSQMTSVGDVVLFMRNGRLFAHRVVRRDAAQFVTRGDAVMDCDPPLPLAQVLGRVTAVCDGMSERAMGWPSIHQKLLASVIRRSGIASRLVVNWRSLFHKLSKTRIVGMRLRP